MKISDFEDVEKCMKVLDKIEKAEDTLRDHLTKQSLPDSGGIPGVADKGYSCHISRYHDGSGLSVNLSGCYVGEEVYESTLEILLTKKREVLKHLQKLGVDISDWSDT